MSQHGKGILRGIKAKKEAGDQGCNDIKGNSSLSADFFHCKEGGWLKEEFVQ